MKPAHFASLLLLASCSVTLQAAEPPMFTSVALFKVKPDKLGDFLAASGKVFNPVLDKLLASGTVLAYGMDVDMFHSAGEPNVVGWYVVASRSSMQKTEEAMERAQMQNPAAMKIFLEASDINAHRDLFLSRITGKVGRAPAGVKPYTQVSYFKANPGKGLDLNKGFEKYFKPIYDKLVDDGVILAYEFADEAIHSQGMSSRWVILQVADLAALDKAEAAIAAARAAMSPAERSIMLSAGREAIDDSAHRDHLYHAAFFASK